MSDRSTLACIGAVFIASATPVTAQNNDTFHAAGQVLPTFNTPPSVGNGVANGIVKPSGSPSGERHRQWNGKAARITVGR